MSIEPLGRVPQFSDLSPVGRAIIYTIAYADLFSSPLTAEEIHEGLIGERATLSQVRHELDNGALLKYIQHKESYFFLRGRKHLIKTRQIRESTSGHILVGHRKLLWLICNYPFVKSVSLSGAIAFKNSRPDDDIDLFLIVDAGRLWLVYTSLVILMKLLGKRNLICLNYIRTPHERSLSTQDFFVAHQISSLRPLSGNRSYRQFIERNGWVHGYLPQFQPATISQVANKFVAIPRFDDHKISIRFLRWLQTVAGLRIFDFVESLLFRFYGNRIRRLTADMGNSVVVSREQIKLFTNDHRHETLQRLQSRLEDIEERICIEPHR